MKNDSNQPYISIVLPIYNTEAYLRCCIDSILAQTYHDFELICINDGSTDGSLAILEDYKKSDDRLAIFSQTNKTLGAARNRGLSLAGGKYVLFLDSDDFFEPEMLEKNLMQAEKTKADIVLSKYRIYDMRKITCQDDISEKGLTSPIKALNEAAYSEAKGLNKEKILRLPVFSRSDIPEQILNITNPAVWNKFYRKDFLDKEHILFQILPNAEDVFFTYISICTAERISWIDEAFINYRIGRKDSLESQKDKYPLCFIEAEKEVFDELHRRGIYRETESSFINRAITDLCYSLQKLEELTLEQESSFKNKAFFEAKNTILNDFIPYTKLLDYPDSFYTNPKQVQLLKELLKNDEMHS